MKITARHNREVRITTTRVDEGRVNGDFGRSLSEAAEATRAESTRPTAADDSWMVNLSREARQSNASEPGDSGVRQIYDQALKSFAGQEGTQTEQLFALASEEAGKPEPSADQSTSAGFVESAYEGLLGREPDAEGAQAWKTQLDSGRMTSADLVANFLKSEEFRGHELENEEAVELLYDTVLGRTADAEGLAFHTNLAKEQGIDAVVQGLFGSDEFKNREAQGLIKGRFAPEPVPTATPTAAAPTAPPRSNDIHPESALGPESITLEDLDGGDLPSGQVPTASPEFLNRLPEADRIAYEQRHNSNPAPTTSAPEPDPSLGPNHGEAVQPQPGRVDVPVEPVVEYDPNRGWEQYWPYGVN